MSLEDMFKIVSNPFGKIAKYTATSLIGIGILAGCGTPPTPDPGTKNYCVSCDADITVGTSTGIGNLILGMPDYHELTNCEEFDYLGENLSLIHI